MIDYRAAQLTEARELTLFRSSGKVVESQMYTRNSQNSCRFMGGTDGRIIVSRRDAAALIRPRHEQNIRTKSQRCSSSRGETCDKPSLTAPNRQNRRLKCSVAHRTPGSLWARRGGADPALEGKARRRRTGGFERQSHRPTGRRHRAAEPDLVRAQYGRTVTDIQRWVRHPVHRYLAATLDGFVNDLDAVFEAKFMLPGRSPKKRPPKSTWRSCSTTCG